MEEQELNLSSPAAEATPEPATPKKRRGRPPKAKAAVTESA